jgi:hypothetical protein
MVSGVYPILAPNMSELFNARIRLRIVLEQAPLKSSEPIAERVDHTRTLVSQPTDELDRETEHRFETQRAVTRPLLRERTTEPVAAGRHYSVCVEQAAHLQLTETSNKSVIDTVFTNITLMCNRFASSVILVAFTSAGKQTPNCTSFVPVSASPIWEYWYDICVGESSYSGFVALLPPSLTT